MRFLIPILASLALTILAPAQDCASLSVTGEGKPGTDVTFAFSGGAAHSLVFVAIGDTVGATSLNFCNVGTLDLGLATPFVPLPLGFSDMNGDLSRTFTVPTGVTLPVLELHGQGLTVDLMLEMPMGGGLSIALAFCTSGVEDFKIGG